MTAPLTYLKVLIICVTGIFLSACHSSSSTNSATPDINTLHVYTSDQIIYSYNEETGISTKRGEFDTGVNKFLELNTDESKQGYEYAIYVFENDIYLLNYDKDTNAETIQLASIKESQTICNLIPHKTSSKYSFSDKQKSNRSTLNLPIVTIEYQQTGNDCDPEFNLRDELNFNAVIKDSTKVSQIKRTLGKASNSIGSLVINYSAEAELLENDIASYDETGFLGQDIQGNQLVFDYFSETEYNQWETSFYPSTGVQTIHQASNNQVVVKNDDDIFVLNANNLFEINKDTGTTPIQDKLDKLFEIPTENFDSSFPLEFNQSQNQNSFLIKHNNSLFYFSPPKFDQIPSNETLASQNATKMKFDLMSDNTALVVQKSNDTETLLAISTISGQSTTIISASKIEFYIIENEFYVNTLDAQADSGWEAHWFKRLNNSFTSKTYEDSRFIFSYDLRAKNDSIFLLSTNISETDSSFISHSLYIFDSSQANGRKKGMSSNNVSVDFLLGQLSTNVDTIISSRINNDKYGAIILSGINGDSGAGQAVEDYYYFDPSQEKADPSIKEQSLKLMLRKIL